MFVAEKVSFLLQQQRRKTAASLSPASFFYVAGRDYNNDVVFSAGNEEGGNRRQQQSTTIQFPFRRWRQRRKENSVVKGNDIVTSYSLLLYKRRCFSSLLTPGTLLYRRIKEEMCHGDKRERSHFSCLRRSAERRRQEKWPLMAWQALLLYQKE